MRYTRGPKKTVKTFSLRGPFHLHQWGGAMAFAGQDVDMSTGSSGVLLKMEVGIRKGRGEGPEGTLLIYDH